MAFRDNGDGTVTDDSTGLMWEKKAPVGAGCRFRRAQCDLRVLLEPIRGPI